MKLDIVPMEPNDPQTPEPVLVTAVAAETVKAVSKRQLKQKMRRAERDPVERLAKKRKAKRDAKNIKRFQAEAPKYSLVHGIDDAMSLECVEQLLAELMELLGRAGYRMVEPYVYEFRTFAKARWFHRELLEIFIKEFGANSPEYYVSLNASIFF